MKKAFVTFVFCHLCIVFVFGQSCVNLSSSTIRLNTINSGSPSICNYTFTPVATISGNAVKLAVVTVTVGSVAYNICYTNTGTDIVSVFNGTTPCGSTNDKLSSGNTTFPSTTFSVPCGNTTFTYAGYNGASTGGGTGICVSGSVPITFVPTYTSSGTSLPIKLTKFIVNLNLKLMPELVWDVEEAENFKEFTVQKSNDAINFENIGIVKFSNSINKYSFVDYAASIHKDNYYRLRLNDIDGEFRYSSIVSINKSEYEKLKFYPNPNFSKIFALNKTIKNGDILAVHDKLGKKVLFNYCENKNQIEILENYIGSLYVKVKDKELVKTEKIILLK